MSLERGGKLAVPHKSEGNDGKGVLRTKDDDP